MRLHAPMPAATTAVGESPRTKTRARHTRACTLKAARRELLELITAAPADEPRLHQHLWRTMHPLRPSAATRPPSTTDTAVGVAGRKELPPTGRDAAAPCRATEFCNLVPSANSSAPRGQPRVRNPNHRQVRRARALRRPSARSACKLVASVSDWRSACQGCSPTVGWGSWRCWATRCELESRSVIMPACMLSAPKRFGLTHSELYRLFSTSKALLCRRQAQATERDYRMTS